MLADVEAKRALVVEAGEHIKIELAKSAMGLPEIVRAAIRKVLTDVLLKRALKMTMAITLRAPVRRKK